MGAPAEEAEKEEREAVSMFTSLYKSLQGVHKGGRVMVVMIIMMVLIKDDGVSAGY